jgi:hypothetical protein
MARPAPSPGAAPVAQSAGRERPADRNASYSRWCVPAGYRPEGLSGCLCASTSRSGGCGERSAPAIPSSPQLAGSAASPSSVARSSSEMAPSLSQMPK